MTTNNLEKCDACNKEFIRGETYSVMNYHYECIPKKEPKVYHHENRLQAVIGKLYEPWTGMRWANPVKLFKITGDVETPFVIEHISDGKKICSLFTIIRECEQPQEKSREVTIDDIKKKALNTLRVIVEGDIVVIMDRYYQIRQMNVSDLFGEKVVVKD